jgi:hypothetical protein
MRIDFAFTQISGSAATTERSTTATRAHRAAGLIPARRPYFCKAKQLAQRLGDLERPEVVRFAL